VGVAVIRAKETQRPDRLFEDQFASVFVRAAHLDYRGPKDEEMQQRLIRLAHWVTVRTRFLDELLLRACNEGCRQVVVLGAGLDARAFRLAWPSGLALWEVDTAEMFAFKEQVIRDAGWRAVCKRTPIETDLVGDWSSDLLAGGYDPTAPVAWLAEGLFSYLPFEVVDSIVAETSRLSVPRSRFGCTLGAPGAPRTARETAADADRPNDFAALWISTAPENSTEWLNTHGWRADTFDPSERSFLYGRSLPSAGTHDARLVDAVRT